MDISWFMRREGVSPRQARLFACACARHIWDAFDEPSRKAIEVAEAFAEGQASAEEMKNARLPVSEAKKPYNVHPLYWDCPPTLTMAEDICAYYDNGKDNGAYPVAHAASYELRHWYEYQKHIELGLVHSKILYPDDEKEPHRIYNKFINELLPHYKKTSVKKMKFSQNITELAHALYHGEQCWFALHDALLEKGFPLLANHFSEGNHPKGCRRLDMILGKI